MATSASLKEKCDPLIRRAEGIADRVRGKETSVQLKNCIGWKADIYSILTTNQHAAPYLYTSIASFIKTDIEVNFLMKGRTTKDVFSFVADYFREFKIIAKAIVFAFSYLDQYYTARDDREPLPIMVYSVFRKTGYNVIKTVLLDSIIVRLNSWRDGEQQDVPKLASSIDFFKSIGLAVDPRRSSKESSYFHEDFLAPCISRSMEYYRRLVTSKQSSISQEGGALEYFRWVECQLAREESLMSSVGLSVWWDPIKKGLITSLISIPCESILDSPTFGIHSLLSEKKDVSIIYKMCALMPEGKGVDIFATRYTAFILNSVQSLLSGIQKETNPSRDMQDTFGNIVLFLEEQLRTIIPLQFCSSTKLYNSWSLGTNFAFRTSPEMSSKLLSNYIDVYLASTQVDDAEEGGKLDLFKSLFSCLVQKDAFFEHYRVALARRLLRGQYRRTSESQMLTRLKMVAGNTEVHQLAMMISDMDTSDKLSSDMAGGASMEAFLSSERLKARAVLVASQYWPGLAHVAMVPAPIISKFITLFESFYQARFSNRKIRWLFQSSTGVVSVRFAQGPKDITGSLPQVTIMLLVDGTAGMRIPALVEATGLPKETVADAIASMYMNKKCNVIECFDPRSGTAIDVKRLSDGFLYRLNAGFRAPVRKIDLPKPAPAKPVDTANIEVKRKELANIAIVRYMKSRGVSQYSEMLDGCLRDLRQKFDAQPPLVKAQLDFLIEKEYVRRDEADSAKLIYIA